MSSFLSCFLMTGLVALLAVNVDALSVHYETLFRGITYTAGTPYAGTPYWTSEDGEWKGYAYYGIKYANAKRFEPSTINTDHTYLQNASRPLKGYACPQNPTEAPYVTETPILMREDCLYLDVYVPPVYRGHQKLGWSTWPVLMWIHGGGFSMGYKDAFDASDLASSIGTVIVVPNYRVGPFGFLSTGDNNAPGNFALYDIKLALKWVHTNIHSFGGDRSKITLAGERAGGALVSMALLDEQVRDVVHGAMTFSGNVFSPWAIKPNPQKVVRELAEELSCPLNTTVGQVSCLKRATLEGLLDATVKVERRSGSAAVMDLLWGPVIDGNQVPFAPSWLLDGIEWKWKGGYVTGYLTNDGVRPLLRKIPRVFGNNMLDHDWILQTFIPTVLEDAFKCRVSTRSPELSRMVYDRYGFVHSRHQEDLRNKIIRLTTDLFFAVPAMKESIMFATNHVASTGNQLYVMASENDEGREFSLPMSDVSSLFSPLKETDGLAPADVVVSRELRRLLSHVVRSGTGFGSQFDPKMGNRLFLKSKHEMFSHCINGALESLVAFWENVRKMGC
ncbi:hypothetical protein RvY_08250 [Ramazzottius varieornatus]|uniref:Carboxylesterase type B domain-containing protein n=1 Tax=Ramazzottius varieornatus TaxID=947166 RepID=A0A1D1V576_RAMVA|nr:hypothetical protein RvY_08250 [Ramazzottius varieornatus]